VTAEPARRIRVLLADDQHLIRAGIRLILRHASDIDVVAEASNGPSAVDLAVQHLVDVVLLDIQMGGADGLTAAEQIAARAPTVRVIMLTTFDDDTYVSRALRAGVAGFLLKDCDPDELIHAVHVVADGRAIVSPEITRKLMDRYLSRDSARGEQARQRISALTDRERQILAMIGDGSSNMDIGRKLRLGEGTVKTYVSRILTKIGCTNRVQAAVLAHDAAISDP
jgi:DNA-binding NarL/FixJ family response regulator